MCQLTLFILSILLYPSYREINLQLLQNPTVTVISLVKTQGSREKCRFPYVINTVAKKIKIASLGNMQIGPCCSAEQQLAAGLIVSQRAAALPCSLISADTPLAAHKAAWRPTTKTTDSMYISDCGFPLPSLPHVSSSPQPNDPTACC